MKNEYCDELHIKHDGSGCTFIIAMNTTYGNKSNGGTRMADYSGSTECSELEAGIAEAFRLVEAMTKKCVMIGKRYNGGYSGGKGLILGNPETQKTPDMLRRFGEFVQTLEGRFQTGTDMNINLQDIEYMAEKSKFIDGLASGLGDTAVPTAYGVLIAMKKLCEWKYGNDSLSDRVIAVQGYGSVGQDLVRRLLDEGAKVILTDLDLTKLNSAKNPNIQIVNPEEIYRVNCDIFSPNAAGGVLTKETIDQLNCSMVIGAANNPIGNGLNSVLELDRRGIIYAPDYVVNIGGVFLSMCEVQGKDLDYVFSMLSDIIPSRLKQVIEESEKNNKTLYESAEALVKRELEVIMQRVASGD